MPGFFSLRSLVAATSGPLPTRLLALRMTPTTTLIKATRQTPMMTVRIISLGSGLDSEASDDKSRELGSEGFVMPDTNVLSSIVCALCALSYVNRRFVAAVLSQQLLPGSGWTFLRSRQRQDLLGALHSWFHANHKRWRQQVRRRTRLTGTLSSFLT